MLLHAIIVVSVTLVLASMTGQAVARVKKKAEGPIKAHPELGLSATMPGRRVLCRGDDFEMRQRLEHAKIMTPGRVALAHEVARA
jgi:hypothetical protein